MRQALRGRGSLEQLAADAGRSYAGRPHRIQLLAMTAESARPDRGSGLLKRRRADLRRAGDARRLPRTWLRHFEFASKRALTTMRRLGKTPDVYQLIHCDLGFGNHVFYRGSVGAI